MCWGDSNALCGDPQKAAGWLWGTCHRKTPCAPQLLKGIQAIHGHLSCSTPSAKPTDSKKPQGTCRYKAQLEISSSYLSGEKKLGKVPWTSQHEGWPPIAVCPSWCWDGVGNVALRAQEKTQHVKKWKQFDNISQIWILVVIWGFCHTWSGESVNRWSWIGSAAMWKSNGITPLWICPVPCQAGWALGENTQHTARGTDFSLESSKHHSAQPKPER